ncbi:hypothetical protein Tco_0212277 [Tanacetum coccineum]
MAAATQGVDKAVKQPGVSGGGNTTECVGLGLGYHLDIGWVCQVFGSAEHLGTTGMWSDLVNKTPGCLWFVTLKKGSNNEACGMTLVVNKEFVHSIVEEVIATRPPSFGVNQSLWDAIPKNSLDILNDFLLRTRDFNWSIVVKIPTAIACAIFMASLSLAGSLNGDTVALTYDSDILSEVPHYDTYHENDVLNSVGQETKYTKHFVSNNDSYDELTSDSNVISYPDYMVTIEHDVTQYVPPLAQDNAMILKEKEAKGKKGNNEDGSITEGKDKVVKEEEAEVPVKKTGKRKKQKARKGINIGKTAQDSLTIKENQLRKDKLKMLHNQNLMIGEDAFQTATKPAYY